MPVFVTTVHTFWELLNTYFQKINKNPKIMINSIQNDVYTVISTVVIKTDI